jgi:hypothetical protein
MTCDIIQAQLGDNMELLNILMGILILAVIYSLVDNFSLRLKVNRYDRGLRDMWVALSALKQFTLGAVTDLNIKELEADAAINALVDALERFDERIGKLEPTVEEPLEDEL